MNMNFNVEEEYGGLYFLYLYNCQRQLWLYNKGLQTDNNNMLKQSDFTKDKSIGIVTLKDDGYKKVMGEWNNTINEYITISSLGKKYNWKSIIQFECYKIIKHWNTDDYDFNFYTLYGK